jgi:hypothetical protein
MNGDLKRRHRKPLFPEGEPRFVYAKDARLGPDGPLVFLPDGEANSLRPLCKEGHLWCPYPDCDTRFGTARGGERRRHHFVHEFRRRDFVHTSEGYFHMLGKNLIRQWARRHYPAARVQEEVLVENGQKPDVLVTMEDGRRFAFEIQYSALPLEDAKRRHDGFRALDIKDVWLLGHRAPHLTNALSANQEQVRLANMGQAQRHLTELGAQVFWIAPEEMEGGSIATAWTASIRQVSTTGFRVDDQPIKLPSNKTNLGGWSWRHLPSKGSDVFHFELDPLAECRLEGQHFVTPELRRLWEEQARIESLTASHLDALRRQAEAQSTVRTRMPAQAEPDNRTESSAGTSALPNSGGQTETPRKSSHQTPAPSSSSPAHLLHSTLAALQKHPWFIVRTGTRCYVTGAVRTTFEVRDLLQIGGQEGTRRRVGSVEEGISLVTSAGHEVVVLEQEVLSLNNSDFCWAPPVPINWSLEGNATKRIW